MSCEYISLRQGDKRLNRAGYRIKRSLVGHIEEEGSHKGGVVMDSKVGGHRQHRGYMRREDAAKYLGVSVRTIGNMMNRRVIPYYKVSRGIVLFAVDEMDEALKRVRVRAVGEDL